MGHATSTESTESFQRVDILFKVQTSGGSKLTDEIASSPLIVSSTLQTATISVTLQNVPNLPLLRTNDITDLTWNIFMALKLHELTQKDTFVKNLTSREIVQHIHQIYNNRAVGNMHENAYVADNLVGNYEDIRHIPPALIYKPIQAKANKYVRVCYTISSTDAIEFLDKLKSLNKLFSENMTCKLFFAHSRMPQELDFLLNFTTNDHLVYPGSHLVIPKNTDTSSSIASNRVGMLTRAGNLAQLGRTAFRAVSNVVNNQAAGNVLKTVNSLMQNKPI